MSQARVTSRSVRRIRGVFYGWWLAGVAALVMVIGTVPVFSAMPAWFVVLERNFGWSRAELSLAFSLTRVEGSIMGPVAGYLIDRLGPRRMVLIGMPILGGGFLLFSQIQNLWQFYFAFIVMSMGAGLGTWLPMMTALNNWFRSRRATAMAIAMEGFSVGGVALVPALAWAIDPDQFGPDRWRVVAAGIGVALILLAFPSRGWYATARRTTVFSPMAAPRLPHRLLLSQRLRLIGRRATRGSKRFGHGPSG